MKCWAWEMLRSEKRARKSEGDDRWLWHLIIVSHSQGFMMEICDRIILMDNGKVVDVGEPAMIYEQYNQLLGTDSS